jgi:hypothetical protein
MKSGRELMLQKTTSKPNSLLNYNHSKTADIQNSEADVKLAPVNIALNFAL